MAICLFPTLGLWVITKGRCSGITGGISFSTQDDEKAAAAEKDVKQDAKEDAKASPVEKALEKKDVKWSDNEDGDATVATVLTDGTEGSAFGNEDPSDIDLDAAISQEA